jgi:hypothetical protein
MGPCPSPNMAREAAVSVGKAQARPTWYSSIDRGHGMDGWTWEVEGCWHTEEGSLVRVNRGTAAEDFPGTMYWQG